MDAQPKLYASNGDFYSTDALISFLIPCANRGPEARTQQTGAQARHTSHRSHASLQDTAATGQQGHVV